jgi:hypothetical protein
MKHRPQSDTEETEYHGDCFKLTKSLCTSVSSVTLCGLKLNPMNFHTKPRRHEATTNR